MLLAAPTPPPNPLPQGEGGYKNQSTSRLDTGLAAELERLRAENLYRVRRIVEGAHGTEITVNGRRCVNFCSNDYLGLAADPHVAEAARQCLSHCGTGSGAAALVSGYNREHQALEEELAAFVQRPRALLFASGWAANLGVLRALLGKTDTLIADELNHASLIDGGRLSGAHYTRVAHRDTQAFARAIERDSGLGTRDSGITLVATDSVFSMDGDLAPLPELAALCQRHNAALMVDDAHGFGVLGANGRGAIEYFFSPSPQSRIPIPGIPSPASRVPGPEIYVATLGKALGCAGAFVAGSENLIEYLIQRARSWVFSTAPPPALAAAARAALRLVQAEPERRARLFENVQRFRRGCEQLGIPLGSPKSRLPSPGSRSFVESRVPGPESRTVTPIQPLILGDERRALTLSQRLFERGYWAAAIRPPTVPPDTSRLRITLSCAHTAQQIDGLVNALADHRP